MRQWGWLAVAGAVVVCPAVAFAADGGGEPGLAWWLRAVVGALGGVASVAERYVGTPPAVAPNFWFDLGARIVIGATAGFLVVLVPVAGEAEIWAAWSMVAGIGAPAFLGSVVGRLQAMSALRQEQEAHQALRAAAREVVEAQGQAKDDAMSALERRLAAP